jgi:threonine/homoserine/homoserine lactone efflux protein
LLELWKPLITGAGYGLLMAVMIGPVFFVLIQTSIEKGFLVGLVFATGIILSDSTYFMLAYLGLSQFENSVFVHKIMGSGGGLFLLGYGFILLFKKQKVIEGKAIEVKGSLFRSFLKGFIVNSLNLPAFFFWIAVIGSTKVTFGNEPKKIFVFFIACMAMIFSTDNLKAYLATRLKHLVTPSLMTWLNRIAGIFFLAIGFKLLYEVIAGYFLKHYF